MPRKKFKVWALFSEEEKPLGLFVAKTEGGAYSKYEKKTGRTRYGLHAEQVNFEEGCFLFVCST